MSNELLKAKIDYLKNKHESLSHLVFNKEKGFQVSAIDFTLIPQTLMYLKLHQCYSENFIGSPDELEAALGLGESRCGEICVKRLLEGNKGHFGIVELPSISFACGFADHDSMVQARTHRIGTSFGVQSMRYTSKQFLLAAKGEMPVEKVIFLEKPGTKVDRAGNKVEYTEEEYKDTVEYIKTMIQRYAEKVESGIPPEVAREVLPHNYRQHFVVTFNLRSLLHFCDLRLKKNAQSNIVELAEMMYGFCSDWVPEIAQWYTENRKGKARLSP